jgi:N-acetyl-alpha-D-muramate 1-phosphate uridylyltransferase
MPSVAILAGGLATRLYPETETIPKSLLPVAGEPFLRHQLLLLKEKGIRRVVLCLGHLGGRIAEYLALHRNFGLQIDCSFDGERLLGTGGALQQALPLLGDPFFVLYGDSYLDIDYSAVAAAFAGDPRLGLMTVLKNDGRWDTSNVIYARRRILAYAKVPQPGMRHIDYGLGLMRHDAFRAFAAAHAFDLAALYGRLAEQGQLAGFVVRRRFYEIGSRSGLGETESYIAKRRHHHGA